MAALRILNRVFRGVFSSIRAGNLGIGSSASLNLRVCANGRVRGLGRL